MINFLNDEVRREFHLLSLEKQREFMHLGEQLRRTKQRLTVLYVERFSTTTSEITIRIDQEFNIPA